MCYILGDGYDWCAKTKKKERENVKNREGGAGGVNQWSCPNVEVLVFLNVHLQGWLMYTIPL